MKVGSLMNQGSDNYGVPRDILRNLRWGFLWCRFWNHGCRRRGCLVV